MANKLTAAQQALARTAELRALLATFFMDVDKPLPVADIKGLLSDKLTKMKVNEVALARQLKSMSDNGQLYSERNGRANLYANKGYKSAFHPKPVKGTAKKSPGKKLEVKIKPPKGAPLTAYKVDVVRGQKRLRITIDDWVVEIGEVDA